MGSIQSHLLKGWIFICLMVFPGRNKISGKIEVDETLVGGKKAGKRGRGAEGKSLMVIAVEIMEKGTGRVRMSLISGINHF